MNMQVLQLQISEMVAVDEQGLGRLCARLGQGAAQDVLCRALEEMALRLSRCERFSSAGDWSALEKDVRALGRIAERIAMPLLALVATDVRRCLAAQDQIAVAATLARLIRIGECSLVAIWDLREVPG
ncbi:hypothetical protein ACFSUD_08760 [Sulfitobacter aestuarii]|uniref:Uncharacterized protein n=1 Tax=Sulfitobacter aestuarii TaxID=2161676 RepID=A0ABW5U2I7_9RHOB